MSKNERYPLWCVDHGEGFGEDRYMGPYDERHHASAWGLDKTDRIRKCRRLLPSELPFDANSDDGGIIAELDTLARDGDLIQVAWANFDDPVVRAKVSTDEAVAAFWSWADAHLEVLAFVCEGDEEASETCPECHIMSEHADGCSLGDPTGGER